MTEEQAESTEVQVRVARGRPLTGAILGTLIGLAVAVLLQQQGFWPLDKITVFLMPAVIGVIGLVLLSVKRVGAPGPMIVAFIILIPMAAWGATGLGTVNEVGQLNGGCEVQAQTSVPDATSVTDTSKQDPFLIDPNGSLQWAATSPVVFDEARSTTAMWGTSLSTPSHVASTYRSCGVCTRSAVTPPTPAMDSASSS